MWDQTHYAAESSANGAMAAAEVSGQFGMYVQTPLVRRRHITSKQST